MSTSIRIYVLLHLLSALSLGLLAYAAWRRRRSAPAALPFSLLAVCCACYSAGHAGLLFQDSLPGVRAWLHFEYLGVPWIPGLWVVVVLAYTGHHWQRPARLAGLLAVPLLTFLAHHTDGWLHLFYRHLVVLQGTKGPAVLSQAGVFQTLHLVYSQASLAAGAVLLVFSALQAGAGYRRRHILAVMAGSLVPWMGLLIHLTGLEQDRGNVMPLSLAVAGLFYGYGILRLSMLDLRPLAREQVFTGMRDAAVVVDHQGSIVDFNPAAQRLFPEMERGLDVRQGFAPWPDFVRALLGEDTLKKLTLSMEGGPRRFQVNLFQIKGVGGGGWAAVLADQTEVHRAMEELRHLATTDPLTGASNRRHFQEHLELAFQRSARYRTPLAVILLDLDHFKRINDTFGHAAGDAVLQVTVARVYQCLREMDTLGRLGGEEFAAVLEGTDLEGAMRVAERIREKLRRSPVEWRGESIAVTASLGVAVHLGGPGGDPFDLLRQTDLALYRAKQEGRDRVRS